MRKFNSIEIGSFWKVSHGTENDVNWITRISHKEIRLLRLPHSRLLSFQSCSSEFFDRPNVSPSVRPYVWINEIYGQDHTAERNIKFFVQVSMSSVLFAKKKFLMFERVFLCIHSSCDASLYVFFFSRYFKTDDVICCVFDCHVLCNDHIWIWLQSCVFFSAAMQLPVAGIFPWKLEITNQPNHRRISSKIALKTNVYVLASFSCKSIRDRCCCCWAATFPFLFIFAFGVQIISASIWICWFIGRHSIGRIEIQQHSNHSTNVKCHFTFWCQTHMTLHILCMCLLCVYRHYK